MPRDGSGHSDNAEELGQTIAHGAPTGNEVIGPHESVCEHANRY